MDSIIYTNVIMKCSVKVYVQGKGKKGQRPGLVQERQHSPFLIVVEMGREQGVSCDMLALEHHWGSSAGTQVVPSCCKALCLPWGGLAEVGKVRITGRPLLPSGEKDENWQNREGPGNVCPGTVMGCGSEDEVRPHPCLQTQEFVCCDVTMRNQARLMLVQEITGAVLEGEKGNSRGQGAELLGPGARAIPCNAANSSKHPRD